METSEKEIELLQNRFPWYDEELMNDPNIIKDGLNHMSVDMFNTAKCKSYGRIPKANARSEGLENLILTHL